jgi:MFS family permease
MDVRNRQRLSLSIFFFISGVCFSTWASRIPTIKSSFGLNDAELGTILLFMPIASLAGLPVSGWLISRYDSRKPLTAAFLMVSVSLGLIGLAQNVFTLIAAICFFAFSTRIFNISVNTQAISLQKKFDRRINGSFHGLWSTGGIVGVAFSTAMVAFDVDMAIHLAVVGVIAIITTFSIYKNLLRHDRAKSGNKLKVGKPDPYIVYLGLLVFFAAVCEGGMFDWSGIYFREVVKEELFTLGYLIFMICMATSRFASDSIVERFGMPKTYFFSAVLIFCGISLAIGFPGFWTSMIGFCLVGFGSASIIPMTYLLAGASTKYSAGMAISIIATYSIVGMLIGPPMIGYISHAFSLRISFIAFAVAGLMMIPISQLFFSHRKKTG